MLRVWQPKQAGDTVADYLATFFDLREAATGQPLSERTRRGYEQTAAAWERLAGVPLEEINETDVRAWLHNLARQPGKQRGALMSRGTIRKHAANMRAILRAAAGDRKPVAVRVPRCDRRRPLVGYTVPEVGQIIRATRRCRGPYRVGIPTAEWWRAFIGVQYFTGERVEACLLLRWDYFRGDEIDVPGEIRKAGVPHFTICHPVLLEWLEPLRQADGPYVFTAGDGHAYAAAVRAGGFTRSLARAHNLARERAGVPNRRNVNWHGYRKCHLTELSLINPLAAHLSSSHAGGSILETHYLDVRRVLRESIPRLPVPPTTTERNLWD